jgi:hypothetical protein
MTELIACIKEWRALVRRMPVDRDVAIGKWRLATPHMYEAEAIARRGC